MSVLAVLLTSHNLLVPLQPRSGVSKIFVTTKNLLKYFGNFKYWRPTAAQKILCRIMKMHPKLKKYISRKVSKNSKIINLQNEWHYSGIYMNSWKNNISKRFLKVLLLAKNSWKNFSDFRNGRWNLVICRTADRG